MHLLLFLAAALTALPALATDFTVSRLDDPPPGSCLPADCSLREAVIAANTDPDADRILLGPGIHELTLPGTGEDDSATGDLDLLRNVEILGVAADQTMIYTAGVDRVLEVRSSADEVTLRDVTLFGGGGGDGQGLYVFGATVLVVDTAIQSCSGGGITAFNGAHIDLVRSSVVENGSVGLFVGSGVASATVTNSTLSGNGLRQIDASGGDVDVVHGTIVGDHQAAYVDSSGTIDFANTVVQGGCTNNGGTFTSSDGNYEAPAATCSLNQPNDVDGAFTAGLEVLDYWYGSPTPVHIPVDESPQIDNAEATLCTGVDQIGHARPVDGDDSGTAECDRGAVEYIPALFVDGFESGDTNQWT